MPEDNVKDFMQQVKEKKQLYQNVFESPDGAKVLEDLSKTAFANKTTFNENPNKMAFNEGQRSIILHIKNMMKIDLEKTESLVKKQQQSGGDNV